MAAVGTDMIALALALPKSKIKQAADQDDQPYLHALGQEVPGARPDGWFGWLLLEFDGGLGHMGCGL